MKKKKEYKLYVLFESTLIGGGVSEIETNKYHSEYDPEFEISYNPIVTTHRFKALYRTAPKDSNFYESFTVPKDIYNKSLLHFACIKYTGMYSSEKYDRFYIVGAYNSYRESKEAIDLVLTDKLDDRPRGLYDCESEDYQIEVLNVFDE
jgi:hypothetical protein